MTTNNNSELIKDFAIMEELDTSSRLIYLGFGELQNLKQSNHFHFLSFQLLSQGFERLMKAHICLGYFDQHGKYPDFKYVTGFSHDLEKLLKEIIEKYFIDAEYPVLKSDKDFLQNDIDLKEIMYIISEFGKLARYYNFDKITDYPKQGINPKQHWQNFENRILLSNPEAMKKLENQAFFDEVHRDLYQYILVIFEKFVSALSHQFNFGGLGEKGKQFYTPFYDFAMLFFPNDFGKKDYRQKTMTYQQAPRQAHKRTLKDEHERNHNPNYKSKSISQQGFDGEWPFYADEVIIECRDSHWCIVTIDGYDYALNGSAKGLYKLENAHDAGMAILGKGTGDFLKMALDLERIKPTEN